MEPNTVPAKGAMHYVIQFLFAAVGFGLPFLLTQFPAVANLTIGAALTTGFDYLKHKFA